MWIAPVAGPCFCGIFELFARAFTVSNSMKAKKRLLALRLGAPGLVE